MSDISQVLSVSNGGSSQFLPTASVIPSPITTLQSYLDPSFIARNQILIAARVRPFQPQAHPPIDASTVACVSMKDSGEIIVTNPNLPSQGTSSMSSVKMNVLPSPPIKPFRFDRHYWSHSGFEVDAKTGERIAVETTTSATGLASSDSASTSSNTNHPPKYASQQCIFADVAPPMLSALFAGKPSVCMAYGETGSGKTYTIVGDQSNPGLVHRIGADLFAMIDLANKAAPVTAAATDIGSSGQTTTRYRVELSMLESYLERVRDLLTPAVSVKGLDNYAFSFGRDQEVIEGVTPIRVESFSHLQQLIAQGLHNQFTTSPNPSRAHTLYELSLVKEETTVSESVNGAAAEGAVVSAVDSSSVRSSATTLTLVDLGGSQRATSRDSKFTDKETSVCLTVQYLLRIKTLKNDSSHHLRALFGCHFLISSCSISASFGSLGNVICALQDIARGRKKVFVPYRNSCLTRMLKKPLSQGSSHFFILTLSPEPASYDETLGQLRFADRCVGFTPNIIQATATATASSDQPTVITATTGKS